MTKAKTRKKPVSSKEAVRIKQRRRGWLTFVRMCRYGINSFSRNAWLTVAATAVMSITLLIVFMTMSARQILLDTASNISKQADMSIYLKGDTPEKEINAIKSRIAKLDNVIGVKYVSAEEARDQQAKQYEDDPEALEAIKESSNEMSATLRVSVEDLNNQKSLENFIKTDKLYKKYKDPRQEPSFSGDRQQAHDIPAVFRIQVASRLVSDQNFRLAHYCPGNRHPLLLAARQLIRKLFFLAFQAH